jgi:phosphonoacetaldehyde hydrolase
VSGVSWEPGSRVRAVIFDWAGTVVDHGSQAPVIALREAFAALGITLTEDQARGPMGVGKRDHIAALLQLPEVADQWRVARGRHADDGDVSIIFDAFQDLQIGAIEAHGDVIPGVTETVATLRARGIAIGSTTGYARVAVLAAARVARSQGFVPDVVVANDDVPAGRPAPWMMYRAFESLRVFPPWTVVKVGDTAVDMAEGRNAGAWAIGVTETGNEFGLDVAGLAALSDEARVDRRALADQRLTRAGAHQTLASVAVLLDAIDVIDALLASGARP